MFLQIFEQLASHMWIYIVLMKNPTSDQFQMFSLDVDAKLIKDQDVIVFIHLGAGWAVVLVIHALTIKESNKHGLTALFYCHIFFSRDSP